MRARWNETTEAILVALASGKSTVKEIAKEIESEEGNVSTILLRLFRAGHVGREKVEVGKVVIDREEGVSRPKYIFEYSITDRGGGRLQYLQNPKKGRRR
jgi:predicted transcriptional regulator